MIYCLFVPVLFQKGWEMIYVGMARDETERRRKHILDANKCDLYIIIGNDEFWWDD